MTTNARLDIRLNDKIKANAEKASALLGLKSLTEYVVKLMEEDAAKVIAKHESMTVENNVFDKFWDACNKTSKPNAALQKAAKQHKEQGFK